jgi:hypothetical protein
MRLLEPPENLGNQAKIRFAARLKAPASLLNSRKHAEKAENCQFSIRDRFALVCVPSQTHVPACYALKLSSIDGIMRYWQILQVRKVRICRLLEFN